MLYNSLDGNSDQWTCAINGPGSYEGDLYWLECADIASATTMSNTFDPEDDDAVRQVNYSSTNQFASKIGQVEIAQQTLTLQGTIEHSSNSKLPTMKQSHSQLELQQTVKSHPSSTKGEVRIRRPGPPEIKSAKRSVSLQRE